MRRRRGIVVTLAAILLTACTQTPPPAPPLDAHAQAACDAFAPIAGDVRSAELTGPPLYRELQDVWNDAQRSQNTDVRENAQALLTAAISEDRQAVSDGVTALQLACNLPFE